MNSDEAVLALSALAQTSRLSVFRLLVQAGSTGQTAGNIAQTLDIPPATLSFHLKTLTQAGLVNSHHEGRHVIYQARFDAMNALLAYLTENCCGGASCGLPGTVCQIEENVHETTACPSQRRRY